MANPVGTKEQREESRRHPRIWAWAEKAKALDGLDIAEEREEHMSSDKIHGAYCLNCLELKRKWDKWKGK